jgi:ADP-heptose:LPS heptosyltransferase
VGNDSGISHLAAAVRTPCVTLFQSTDPAVWSPRGPSVWPTRLSGQPACLANPSV